LSEGLRQNMKIIFNVKFEKAENTD